MIDVLHIVGWIIMGIAYLLVLYAAIDICRKLEALPRFCRRGVEVPADFRSGKGAAAAAPDLSGGEKFPSPALKTPTSPSPKGAELNHNIKLARMSNA